MAAQENHVHKTQRFRRGGGGIFGDFGGGECRFYLYGREDFSDSDPTDFPPLTYLKNLLMPLFFMGCFPVDFQEGKRPPKTKSGKCPIKVEKTVH